jgi:cell wall-associated NlpC family hydrolase
MDPKTLAGLAGATLVLVIGAVAGAGLAGGGLAVAACTHPPTAGTAALTTAPVGGWQPVGAWNSQQVANAAIIVAVGRQLTVPARGWVIAVAAAMQESGLRNLPGGDRDSLGLFQQRPSTGWGTPTQLLDPVYAATRFYTALTDLPGWQNLPLTVAAQAVQRSGFPDAYAKWEPDALALVNAVASGDSRAIPVDLEQFVSSGGCWLGGGDGFSAGGAVGLPPGFSFPPGTPRAVVVAVSWALAQLGTPYSYGGDCSAPHSGVAAHQCDCSSLVMAAYAHAGLRLPRTTFQQVGVGTAVASLSQVRPGDLLFIPGSDGTATAPGHVGIHVGNGLLVHAPHRGSNVSLARLTDWAGEVSAIRRVTS